VWSSFRMSFLRLNGRVYTMRSWWWCCVALAFAAPLVAADATFPDKPTAAQQARECLLSTFNTTRARDMNVSMDDTSHITSQPAVPPPCNRQLHDANHRQSIARGCDASYSSRFQ
jgi:hypothetical protein